MSASRTSKSGKSTSRPDQPIFDGRLNLEQQRKRAKELLRDLRSGDAHARTRANDAGHPVHISGLGTVQLADSQLVIARENGFPSWPAMKRHIDQIAERHRQIASGTVPDLDTKSTLHLRCGSDIRNGLEIAGFVGDFLEFADPFCQGPVPDLPLDQFVETRADFIAQSYQIAHKDALARIKREYGALTTLGTYDHVVLWFEHDSYDQLILAFLMDFIAATKPNTKVDLISVGEIPGIDRFIGLGQLSPELLIWCWQNHRMPLRADMLTFGTKVWKALRADDPRHLKTLAEKTTAPLPHMPAALKRHLAELPDPQTGLGLTQKLTLQIIKDHGPVTVGKVFGHLMRRYDPLPCLGDLMFWSEIQWMMDCKDALFTLSASDPKTNWAEHTITLTSTGHETLAGRRNFLDNFTGVRWVGGIRMNPSPA